MRMRTRSGIDSFRRPQIVGGMEGQDHFRDYASAIGRPQCQRGRVTVQLGEACTGVGQADSAVLLTFAEAGTIVADTEDELLAVAARSDLHLARAIPA